MTFEDAVRAFVLRLKGLPLLAGSCTDDALKAAGQNDGWDAGNKSGAPLAVLLLRSLVHHRLDGSLLPPDCAYQLLDPALLQTSLGKTKSGKGIGNRLTNLVEALLHVWGETREATWWLRRLWDLSLRVVDDTVSIADAADSLAKVELVGAWPRSDLLWLLTWESQSLAVWDALAETEDGRVLRRRCLREAKVDDWWPDRQLRKEIATAAKHKLHWGISESNVGASLYVLFIVARAFLLEGRDDDDPGALLRRVVDDRKLYARALDVFVEVCRKHKNYSLLSQSLVSALHYREVDLIARHGFPELFWDPQPSSPVPPAPARPQSPPPAPARPQSPPPRSPPPLPAAPARPPPAPARPPPAPARPPPLSDSISDVDDSFDFDFDVSGFSEALTSILKTIKNKTYRQAEKIAAKELKALRTKVLMDKFKHVSGYRASEN